MDFRECNAWINEGTQVYPSISLVPSVIYHNPLLQGIIDSKKEVGKLRKKQIETRKKIDDIEKKIEKVDYQTKVPQNVKQADADKVRYFYIFFNRIT